MKKNRLHFTEKYLQNKPAFFSLIRPIEAKLMYKNRDLLKGKILDFGCGDGFFANIIFHDEYAEVGLDVGDSRIDDAKDKVVYKELIKYDGSVIPYENNYFGGIFSNSVLEHVPDLEGNIEEISRVMKPGGYFITTVMTQNWDKNLLGAKLLGEKLGGKYREWLRENQDHLNLLSPSDWIDVFEKAGFEIEEQIGYLDKKTSNWMEIWHYLSFPSMISNIIFGKWILWKNWYLLFNLHKHFEKMNKKSFTKIEDAGSIFFVLKKKK